MYRKLLTIGFSMPINPVLLQYNVDSSTRRRLAIPYLPDDRLTVRPAIALLSEGTQKIEMSARFSMTELAKPSTAQISSIVVIVSIGKKAVN